MRVGNALRDEARRMGRAEARYLVDTYYQMQDYRIRSQSQLRAGVQQTDQPPMAVLDWLTGSFEDIEKGLKRLMEDFALSQPVGQWSMAQYGVGPVISAGLIAHIDITKAQTVGAIWRRAGLDPSTIWPNETEANKIIDEALQQMGLSAWDESVIPLVAEKLNRHAQNLMNIWPRDRETDELKPLTRSNCVAAMKTRPYVLKLKTLCWNIGQSFMKQGGKDECFYGKLYRERKAREIELNSQGAFAAQAAGVLRDCPSHAQRSIYAEGRLPDGQIDARARRWAVKLFLSHWHEVAYWAHYSTAPPNPYVFEYGEGEHVHRLDPPHWTRPCSGEEAVAV